MILLAEVIDEMNNLELVIKKNTSDEKLKFYPQEVKSNSLIYEISVRSWGAN